MPYNFKISPFPSVIELRFLAMMQRLSAATQQRKAHQRSKIALGFDFKSSYKKSKSSMILSLTRSPTNTRSPFFQPSHKPFDKPSFLKLVSLPWLRAQSEVPWTMWARPSGITSDETLALTKTGSLHEFYRNNTKAIKTRIQTNHNKKHSLSALSNKPFKIKQQLKRKHLDN